MEQVATRASQSKDAVHLRSIVASLVLFGGLPHAPARAGGADPFDVETLGDGVYAIVRHDPIAFANNANSLVVVGDNGVLVVDAQFTRLATTQTLAAIRRLTTKPVRYVVNTHWHDDHVAGNQVYRDTFPNVEFISHDSTRADLATLGAENRKGTWDVTGPYTARLERLMAQGLGVDSAPIVPLERAALESTIEISRQYLAEKPGFRETLADVTFARELTLHLGGRRVDVRYFGRGNTRGDAVVFVPDAKVVATGDLVVAPVPFAFGAYVGDWIAALGSIGALGAVAIVPGHGPVMHDESYLRHVQRMLVRIRDETRARRAEGASLADVRQSVTLRDERESIAHGDQWLNTLFDTFFLRPSIESAWREGADRR